MQKWFSKATVQAAIISAIPALFTALIAIITIMYTWKAANRQFELSTLQYQRDSINSNLQNKLLSKQIELVNKQVYNDSIFNSKQLYVSQKELESLLEKEKIQQTAYWIKLRNTMWTIFDVTVVPNGFKGWDDLSMSDKENRIDLLWNLLNSEIENPVLMGNVECQAHWKNAISSVKSMKFTLNQDVVPFSVQIKSFMYDIVFIWEKLILNLDQK